MGRLDGKSAIITGAANGIGFAAAELFVAEGARVLLVDLKEAELRAAVGRLGANAAYLTADVSDPASGALFTAEALRLYGRIDVALLNAGIEGQVAGIADLPLDIFDRVMAVNLRGVWIGMAALMPAMKTGGGGSIVITSSIGGLHATPYLAAYGASKHAVIGIMKSAAIEGAPDRIRVNTVNPGPVDTRMIAAIERGRNPERGAARAAGIARIPLRRYAVTADIAAMMLFLASDESSFCTGGTYVVDGGFGAL